MLQYCTLLYSNSAHAESGELNTARAENGHYSVLISAGLLVWSLSYSANVHLSIAIYCHDFF
jgi:hypothetical protein